MNELKTCPLCGAEAIVICTNYRHDETLFRVKCANKKCHVIPSTYENDSMDFVIDVWNRRAEDGK